MTLTADFELGTNGATIATSDAGNADAWDTVSVVASGTCIYDTTHAAYGAQAAKIATAGTSGQTTMRWTTAFGSASTDHYGRLYLYLTGAPGANIAIVHALNGGSTGARIAITTGGKLRVWDAGSNTQDSTATISYNQWVRIEWRMIHSATVGQIEAKLFNTATSGTATETVTSPASWNTNSQATEIRFGVLTSAANIGPFWLDGIAAKAASYPGPLASVTATQSVAIPAYTQGTKTQGVAVKSYGTGTKTQAVAVEVIDSQLAPSAPVLASSGSFSGVTLKSGFDTRPKADTLGCTGHARVILQATFTDNGSYDLPARLVVERSADGGSTWADVTSNCDVLAYDARAVWKVIDKRPAYGSQPVGWQGDSVKYRISGVNAAGTGATATTGAITIAVDPDLTRLDHAEGMSRRITETVSLWPALRDNSIRQSSYPTYWLLHMAYAFYRFGTAQYLTDCQTVWDEITTASPTNWCIRTDDLWHNPDDYPTYVNTEHTGRNVTMGIVAARILDLSGNSTAQTLAAAIRTQLNASMVAVCDLLETTNYRMRPIGVGGPSSATLSAWAATTSYSVGDRVIPTVPNGHYYTATYVGGTSAATEPSWTTGAGDVVSDIGSGTVVVWQESGTYPIAATSVYTWATGTARASGDFVKPTTPNGYIYKCTTAGTTHGSTEPTWPTTPEQTVTDNGVVWRCQKDQTAWATGASITAGEIRRPSTHNGRSYRAMNAGTTHASTEPTWPDTDGATVTDNGITWQDTTRLTSGAFKYIYDPVTLAPSGSQPDNPTTILNQNMGIGAAFMFACRELSSFTSAGAYRTTALAATLAHCAALVTPLQYSDGAIPYGPSGEFLDTAYGSYCVWLGAIIAQFLGAGYDDELDLFLPRILDWLDADHATEPGWSNSDDTYAHSVRPLPNEMGWRAAGYRKLGRTMPDAVRDLEYTTAFQHTDNVTPPSGSWTYKQDGRVPYLAGTTLVDGTKRPSYEVMYVGEASEVASYQYLQQTVAVAVLGQATQTQSVAVPVWAQVTQTQSVAIQVWDQVTQTQDHAISVWAQVTQAQQAAVPVWAQVTQTQGVAVAISARVTQGQSVAVPVYTVTGIPVAVHAAHYAYPSTDGEHYAYPSVSGGHYAYPKVYAKHGPTEGA